MQNETHGEKVQEGFLVSFPQIPGHVVSESGFCLGAKHFKSRLCIRSQTETSTNLDPYGCRLIDLEVDMRMVQKSECESNTADTTADDSDTKLHWA